MRADLRMSGMLRRMLVAVVVMTLTGMCAGCGSIVWPVNRADGQHRACLSYGSYQGDPAFGGDLHNAVDAVGEGAGPQAGGQPASLPMGREPTAECPIVSDVGVPGSYALFGGKDGTKRIRIKWPEGLTDVRISRGGQCAAALVADRNVAEPYVVLYDVEGERVATVRLPREQPQRVSIRNLWLGDRQEAVVYMAGLTRETRPGDPPINPQVYYVNAKGVAELLPVPRTEEVLEVHFPTTPGFALLAKEVKGDFRLQRYESPKRLVWEKTFPRDIPIPRFRPPRADGDIAVINAEGFREYRADGTEVAGGSSE